jgi:FAD binding domain
MTRGRPRDTVIDCAVVGAGPAGLASSAALTRRGVEHVVLERGRVGQSWREQRWDSLRVNNPGWMNPMLGEQEPDTYLTADEVVERLDKLATACPVREGARHRGRDTVEWLVECGFFQQRPQDLVDPSVMAAPQPLLAPGGRSMSLQALARAGVTLAGRLVAAHGERVAVDDSAPANLAAGDAFAARIRAMLDQVIRQAGLHAPPVEPDDADTPVELDPPMALDLYRPGRVGGVVHRVHGRLLLAPPRPPQPRRAAKTPRRCRPAPRGLVRRAALAHPPRLRQLPRPPQRRRSHRRRRGHPTSRKPPSPPWPQHRGDRAPTGLDRAPTPPVRRPLSTQGLTLPESRCTASLA